MEDEKPWPSALLGMGVTDQALTSTGDCPYRRCTISISLYLYVCIQMCARAHVHACLHYLVPLCTLPLPWTSRKWYYKGNGLTSFALPDLLITYT